MVAVHLSDQDELEKIKQRKLRQLLERAEQQQAAKAHQENEQQNQEDKEREMRTQLLDRYLDSEARQYITQMNATKPQTAQHIETIIISLILQNRVNYITKVQIRALERRIEGVEPSISVKRRGKKIESFSDAIRKDQD